MQGTAKWCAGAFVGILGVIGLFLAARAEDNGIHLFGLAVAAFAVLYIFALIKRSFDAVEQRAAAPRQAAAVE
jgi:hypothetical protein